MQACSLVLLSLLLPGSGNWLINSRWCIAEEPKRDEPWTDLFFDLLAVAFMNQLVKFLVEGRREQDVADHENFWHFMAAFAMLLVFWNIWHTVSSTLLLLHTVSSTASVHYCCRLQ